MEIKDKMLDAFYSYQFDEEKFHWLFKAYQKKVDDDFAELLISPSYRAVKDVANSFNWLNQKFLGLEENLPRKMTGFNAFPPVIRLKKMQSDIHSEARFSLLSGTILPVVNSQMSNATRVKNLVYAQLSCVPVGLELPNNYRGFLLLKSGPNPKTIAYRYFLSGINDQPDRENVVLEKMYEFNYSFSCNFSNMKQTLNKMQQEPLSLYLIESAVNINIDNSLRPVAKKKLLNFLNASKQ